MVFIHLKEKRLIPGYKKKIEGLNHYMLKWRNLIKQSFNFDPILCKCGAVMKYSRDSSYVP